MIDLHVINSEKDSVSTITAADEPGITAETLYFTSRQWGYTGGLTKNRPNLWTRHIDENESGGEPDYAGLKTATKIANDDDDNKFDELTLGYLNKFVTATNTVPAGSNLNAAVYKGMPSGNAFMYFPWYDTPLNNSYELMLVPTCSPGRFGVEFDDSEKTADDPTEGWATKGTSLGGQYAKFRDPKSDVGMYFNYFDSGTNSLNLADLFEWIRVPSKFAGSVKWTKDASGNLCPYYTGQEPGKINLNTANEAAWSALQGNTSNLRSYADLQQKRSKLSATGDPENFLTPFRSPGAVNFVPDGLDVQKQNQATLFGEEGTYTTAPPTPTTPKLFVDIVAGSDANANWLAALQPMLQLADMTTTRSNVFAVWVTIGYFEATPSTDTNIPVSSDGNRYELGVEKGIDNGTVKRHRAFYLLDRSIPVGFRRGEVFKDKDDKPQYRDIILKETILE
ncbi:hypothetical protein FACS1894214_3800 [Planctomycetales bacterium]|nr:hypothetical protein FACS1894214_3800 [Planctomycetales bacterium]